MKIGFIGLGAMGMGMARNIIKGNEEYLICNSHDDKLSYFKEHNIPCTNNVIDLATCNIICFCLPDDHAVKENIDVLKNSLKPGTIIIDFSTLNYPFAISVHDELLKTNIHYLDAPISGHRLKANDGTLTIMVGGEEEVFNKVAPYLSLMGTTIEYMGKSGSGQLTKAINNTMLDICSASFSELLPLGTKLGLDPEKLGTVMQTGSGSSYASKMLIPKLLENDFKAEFSLKRAYKDIDNIKAACKEVNISLPTVEGMIVSYDRAIEHGEGDNYKAALIRYYEDKLNVLCRKK